MPTLEFHQQLEKTCYCANSQLFLLDDCHTHPVGMCFSAVPIWDKGTIQVYTNFKKQSDSLTYGFHYKESHSRTQT